MAWTFQYSLNGSVWYAIPNTNIDIGSLTKTEQIHNNLQPVVNTCEFQIVRPTTQQLTDFNNNRNILFSITDAAGSAYFAGILDNEFQFNVDVRVGSFSLKVYDYGWYISGQQGYKIGQRFGPSVWDPPSTVLSNFFVHKTGSAGSSIIDTILARFSAMMGISVPVVGSSIMNAAGVEATVDQFSFKATDTYQSILTEVLFEFGYVYYFDAAGNFCLYNLFPSSLATSHTFSNAADPADMYTGLQYQKKFAQMDGAEVDWYNHILLKKALISFDTSNGYYAPGAPDQSTCDIELPPATNPLSYVWQDPFYPNEYVPGSTIYLPGATQLVGQGGPSTPGNPQTIPWPSPQNGQYWLVTDPGYSDDGYIYQYLTSDHQWHQQSRSLGELATLGALGYEYTTLGWIIITPNPNPIVYTNFQISERTLISVDPSTIEIHLTTDDGSTWPTAPASYNTGIGNVIHPVAEPLICNAAGGALSTPAAPIVLFPDRMFFVLQNTDQFVSYHIVQYYVLGNALVKGNQNIQRVFLIDNLHTNLDVRDTSYIVTQGDANALVNGLANYYKYSGQIIDFDSDSNIACGALVQIDDVISGLNVTCRIRQKKTRSEYDLRGVKGIFPRFSYECEAVNNAVFTAQPQTSYAAVPIVGGAGAGQIAGAVGSSLVASAIYTGIYSPDVGTSVIPSTPSMLNVVPTGLHALSVTWTRQANLTGNFWYEIQCSLDNSNWYQPNSSGSAIVSGIFNGSAVVVTELYNHTNIPDSGSIGAPLGTQVFYRVRCHTQNGLVSAWSTSLSGTTIVVQPGDLAVSSVFASNIVASQITADKMAANFLNAMIAQISNFVEVDGSGFVGTSYGQGGTPTAGASRIRITGNSLVLEAYNAGGQWVTVMQVGGQTPGGSSLFAYVQAKGLIKTGATVEVAALDIGIRAPAGNHIYHFEQALGDTDGAYAFTGSSVVYHSDHVARGSYSLGQGGGGAQIVNSSVFSSQYASDFGTAFWEYLDSQDYSGSSFVLQDLLNWNPTGYIQTPGNGSADFQSILGFWTGAGALGQLPTAMAPKDMLDNTHSVVYGRAAGLSTSAAYLYLNTWNQATLAWTTGSGIVMPTSNNAQSANYMSVKAMCVIDSTKIAMLGVDVNNKVKLQVWILNFGANTATLQSQQILNNTATSSVYSFGLVRLANYKCVALYDQTSPTPASLRAMAVLTDSSGNIQTPLKNEYAVDASLAGTVEYTQYFDCVLLNASASGGGSAKFAVIAGSTGSGSSQYAHTGVVGLAVDNSTYAISHGTRVAIDSTSTTTGGIDRVDNGEAIVTGDNTSTFNGCMVGITDALVVTITNTTSLTANASYKQDRWIPRSNGDGTGFFVSYWTTGSAFQGFVQPFQYNTSTYAVTYSAPATGTKTITVAGPTGSTPIWNFLLSRQATLGAYCVAAIVNAVSSVYTTISMLGPDKTDLQVIYGSGQFAAMLLASGYGGSWTTPAQSAQSGMFSLVGLDYSASGSAIYLSVNDVITSSVFAAITPTAGVGTLTLNALASPLASCIDDLIVLPGARLQTQAAFTSYWNDVQPWSKYIDYLLDLVIVPKSGGQVYVPGPLVVSGGSGFMVGSAWFQWGKEYAYNPVLEGFGTPTSSIFSWSRDFNSNKIKVRGKFASGTTTAIEARNWLPVLGGVQLLSDSALIPSIMMAPGEWDNSGASYGGTVPIILIESGVGYVTFGFIGSAAGLSKGLANTLASNGQIICIDFEVPVNAWN